MKILAFATVRDYGIERQMFVLLGRRRSFLQLSVFLDDSAYYHFQLTSSFVSPLSVLLCLWRFSFSLDVLSRNWHEV